MKKKTKPTSAASSTKKARSTSASPVRASAKKPVTPAVKKNTGKPAAPRKLTKEKAVPAEATTPLPAAEQSVMTAVERVVHSEPTTQTEAVVAPSEPAAAEITPAPVSAADAPAPKQRKEKKPVSAAETPLPVIAESKPASVTSKSPGASVQKPLVCLLGDERLVTAFSGIFQSHGIAVMELKNLATLKTHAKKITAAFELSLLWDEQKRRNLAALDESLPPQIPVATCSVTATVLTQTHTLPHRTRFIGISAFPTLTEHPLFELAPSLYTNKETSDAVTALLTSAKKESVLVQDSIGMVMPRILCQIINEALFAVQQDVASPHDIDEAMKHGTNYPLGPIAWGEQIGFATVTAVLDAIYAEVREERYRTAPLLRQMAVAGVFWNTTE